MTDRNIITHSVATETAHMFFNRAGNAELTTSESFVAMESLLAIAMVYLATLAAQRGQDPIRYATEHMTALTEGAQERVVRHFVNGRDARESP